MCKYNVYLNGKYQTTIDATGYSSGIVRAYEALGIPYGGKYGLGNFNNEEEKDIVTIKECT